MEPVTGLIILATLWAVNEILNSGNKEPAKKAISSTKTVSSAPPGAAPPCGDTFGAQSVIKSQNMPSSNKPKTQSNVKSSNNPAVKEPNLTFDPKKIKENYEEQIKEERAKKYRKIEEELKPEYDEIDKKRKVLTAKGGSLEPKNPYFNEMKALANERGKIVQKEKEKKAEFEKFVKERKEKFFGS